MLPASHGTLKRPPKQGSAPRPALADALRARTRALHTRAERGGIVADVLHGRATLGAYLMLLRNLLPCYEALEAALARHRGAAPLADLAHPDLFRAASIRADLQRHAPDWQSRMELLDAGRAYAACVAACGAGDGVALIAHAYARYLGDLNGGSVIAGRLRPQLDGAALAFHEFPGIGDLDAFRPAYRAAFDRAGALLADWTPVLDEAETAFRFNIEVSEQVKVACTKTPGALEFGD